ncbi:MAG: glycosyltransferase [Acidimicrobiales bacterium]
MRILVVWPGASWATADVARGWADGLEQAGADVVRFRLDQRIEWLERHLTEDECRAPDAAKRVRYQAAESLAGALYEHRPDLTVVVDGKDIPPDVWQRIRARGERVALVHTEAPYEMGRIESMHWCADVHLVNDPVGVEPLLKHTPHAFYAPHSYYPAVHYPEDKPKDHEVVFVGSGFAGRAAFLGAVDWQTVGRLTLAGHWRSPGAELPDHLAPFVADLPEPLPNAQTAHLYRTSKVGLNLYRTDHVEDAAADGWAVGPREVEMAACGLFFLRQPRPEGDALFPMLPTFDSPEELTDLAAWWLAHDDAREEAAAAARSAVADRTFERLAATLLRRLILT